MGKSNQELKYKRLKVGHACYVCRSKKIKCDGLRPCMQCKARGRNCVSSKEESMAQNLPEAFNLENSSCSESDDDSILFSRRAKSLDNSEPQSCYESWTCHAVTSIAKSVRENSDFPHALYSSQNSPFGNFVRWTAEPPLPMHYSHPIEMPSVEVQMHLIDLFFQNHYTTMPVIPKPLFYEQLRIKGPLITPLLLNAIYCTASSYSSLPDVPKPSVFFNRSKKLVDDFLDTPRISTVISLCLLASYEPMPTRGKGSTITQHCRSWMYGGMASRMCLELGLNVDTPETRKTLGSDDVELRRRVFWTCYILDKLQSREWERTWTLPSSLSTASFPTALPNDEHEHRIITAFTYAAKLSILAEEGLQIHSLYAINRKNDINAIFGQLEQYYSRIMLWKHEMSNDACFAALEDTKEPYLARNHLISYSMLIETLLLLPQTAERASKQQEFVSELVKCADIICRHSAKIVQYEVLAHAVGTALRAQKRLYEGCMESGELIGQCLKIFTSIEQRANIPKFSETIRHLNSMYQSSKKKAQQFKRDAEYSQCDQDVRPLSPCLEGKPRESLETFIEYPCHTNIDRPCITTCYQKQPWLQSLHDMTDSQIIMPLTPEDPIQLSTLSSPVQNNDQPWPIPYLPDSAFPPNDLNCQPYFAPFSILSPSNYTYAHSSFYSSNYLSSDQHLDNLSNLSTYQQLYHTN